MQRSDDVAVVKNAPIVFCCDGKARATLVASWYRQLGYGEVYALDGGAGAWAAAGRSLESGTDVGARFDGSVGGAGEPGLLAAARPLRSCRQPAGTGRQPARCRHLCGHQPGFRPGPYPRRALGSPRLAGVADWRLCPVHCEARVVVACGDGRQSLLAAATLRELGYAHAAALDGGMAAWRAAGRPVEEGLAGVMRTPADIVFSGPDRTYADMQNYLRWETDLGNKYAPAAG